MDGSNTRVVTNKYICNNSSNKIQGIRRNGNISPHTLGKNKLIEKGLEGHQILDLAENNFKYIIVNKFKEVQETMYKE